MSYKPGAGNLPMAVVDPTAPIMLPEYVGRWAFLQALQLEAPGFWRELRRLEGDPEKIVLWMTHNHVVDEWLVEVVWSTVAHWSRGPAGALISGERWWRYPLLDDGQTQVPLFRPAFRNPHPMDVAGKLEKPEAFELRMRTQFDKQIGEYRSYLQSIIGEDHTEMRKHSQWTALAFVGSSWVKIASMWHHLDQSYEPDATVKMAVRRFCARIGLTLPRRRGRFRGT
jgi:hypothetical protein